MINFKSLSEERGKEHYHSICVDWWALAGSGRIVSPTVKDPWLKIWVSVDTPLDVVAQLLRILAIGLRPLIIVYHRLWRFAKGLLPSSVRVNESLFEDTSVTSRARLPERIWMLLLVELEEEESPLNNSGLIVGFSSFSCRSSLGASMLFGETFNPGIEIWRINYSNLINSTI